MYCFLYVKSLLKLNTCNRFCLISNRLMCSTIFALSTAIKTSGSAIAVIRMSGSNTLNALKLLTKSNANKWLTRPRTAIYTKIYDIKTNELLDKAIVIWFAKPNSYTGEDMCEFHVHGSNAVISALLRTMNDMEGCVVANRGEFTKRALLNNKMDLIEAEGISHLISAQTDCQRRLAMSAITGTVSNLYNNWTNKLIQLMAHLEANIDFAEDELIDDSVLTNVINQLAILMSQINSHLKNTKRKSDLIKDGIRVTIVGESNAGKSTFINQFSERDLSIVSPISGTTRDIVETWLNINGYAVSISDTAGIKNLDHHLDDPIETQGIIKAIQRAKTCDLILFMIDATKHSYDSLDMNSLQPHYIKQIISSTSNLIYLFNKIDLLTHDNYKYLQEFCANNLKQFDYNLISSLNREGFQDFTNNFTKVIEKLCGNASEETLFTSNRHEAHLTKVVQQINLCLTTIDSDISIGAHHLRNAIKHISHITGKITTDDILDVIFKDFCIGK